MVVRTWPDGTLAWQRVDSYKPRPTEAGEEAPSSEPTSSAAEWVFPMTVTTDGGSAGSAAVGVVTDELEGLGLIQYFATTANHTAQCAEVSTQECEGGLAVLSL